MNPHFIFNALNSIQKFIFEKDEYSASQYLTKFSRLIRLILDQSAQDFINIHSEKDLLTHYLDLEQLRFSHHFNYIIDIADNVHGDWLIPSMVIQPHVENAIWHGLMHNEKDGRLRIAFSTPTKNVLQVIIEDNGVGREKAAEQKSKQVLKKKSYGSSLSSDRLKSLYRLHEKETSTRIEDLYHPDGMPAGTRVTITMPVMVAPEESTAQ
jgi:LytS/YehU family sensor histidine kinase